jgi:SAM-dependent methyltransferase
VWSAGWLLELSARALAHTAAGTLDLASLRAAIARGWDDYGHSEDEILSGLKPWEQDCYARYLKPGDRILVIGCGTGRDVIALARAGHRVEGLDPAAGALAIAARMLDRLGLSAPLHACGIEAFTPPGPYDVFTFSWFSYCYIPQSGHRVEVLRRLARHLAPGGRIIVAYMPTPTHPRLPIGLTRLAARLSRSDWRPEIGDRIWISLPRPRTLHYQHEFVPGEFEAEAEAAGLRPVFHSRGVEAVAVLEPRDVSCPS